MSSGAHISIYWSCLPLSKHQADRGNAVCKVQASIQTGPFQVTFHRSEYRAPCSFDEYRLIMKCLHGARQKGLHKIRVVLLHWSTVQLPVQLHGNRFTVWRILTVLYCFGMLNFCSAHPFPKLRPQDVMSLSSC